MNKEFEKILERLECAIAGVCEHSTCEYTDECCFVDGIYKGKQIVNEVAEEYNGGWIPCSERLPKESYVSIVFNSFSETVLVTRKDLERGINVVSTDFVRDGDFPDYNGVYETIAWIPLPEPYKEDDKRMPYYYGWIPCSVILPEEEEEVIVSQCFHDGRNKVSIAHCFNGDNWFTDDPSYITDVVAWMPLPKPYQNTR